MINKGYGVVVIEIEKAINMLWPFPVKVNTNGCESEQHSICRVTVRMARPLTRRVSSSLANTTSTYTTIRSTTIVTHLTYTLICSVLWGWLNGRLAMATSRPSCNSANCTTSAHRRTHTRFNIDFSDRRPLHRAYPILSNPEMAVKFYQLAAEQHW